MKSIDELKNENLMLKIKIKLYEDLIEVKDSFFDLIENEEKEFESEEQEEKYEEEFDSKYTLLLTKERTLISQIKLLDKKCDGECEI